MNIDRRILTQLHRVLQFVNLFTLINFELDDMAFSNGRAIPPLVVLLISAIGLAGASELPRLLSEVFFGTAPSETLRGQATVSDGDSLRLGGQRVRIFGIDAPELDQTCGHGPQATACGYAARDRLARLVAGRTVTCVVQDRDRYGRLVAWCEAAGHDLGAAMIEAGFAIDYARYSNGRYASSETRARGDRAGLWRDGFTAPAEWRAQRRADETR
ncbi:thermonuclease family protein [Marinivivus vitaminiproducens]|uniref:thermonuclease family protein n=1 Tax=Marinivivus vitaminiproducens TaxID=3035935 RepID=UPI0027A36545|nr:thermonuclease family protein [Geminicoccaceae bacterium SCSIO 64248]